MVPTRTARISTTGGAATETEIHHFIGKDITYFHTLFWPAMLKISGFSLPEKVHIHGFLTVNGEKMSKSKGTFIRASTYLEHLDPSYLRYYYASKLSSAVDDIDLNFDDFIGKVNSDLVGKVVNIASRTAKFVGETGFRRKRIPTMADCSRKPPSAGEEIAQAYENCDYSKAMRLIMAAADRANQYIEANKPWELAKDRKTNPAAARQVQDACTVGLNLFRQLAIYLAPVLPTLAKQTGELLGDPIVSLGAIAAAALGHAGGQVHAHDAAGRSEAGRGDGGRQRRAGPRRNHRRKRLLRQRRPASGRAAGRNHQLRRVRQSGSPRGPGVAAEDVPGAQKLLKAHA